MLTDDEIKALIREAFRPLRCVIEILPDGQLRFQVIKRKNPTPVYTESGIPIEVLRENEAGLRELLRSVRLLLEKRGYRLNLWPPIQKA
jgi:hypothetical protein